MGSETLALSLVVSRDRRQPRERQGNAQSGGLRGLSWELPVGMSCLLGTHDDGLRTLAALLAGEFAPEKGTFAGSQRWPAHDASLRASVACLTAEATLPDLGSVEELLLVATHSWKERPGPSAVLAQLGLESLAKRRVRDLSLVERRSVELCLVLSHPDPRLVVLYEPFSDAPDVDASLWQRLEQRALATPVLVLTQSPETAARFLRVAVLRGGQVAEGDARLGEPNAIQLRAWVQAGGRQLAAALAQSTAVQATGFFEGANESPSLLYVAGEDAVALALAVTDAAVATDAEVIALQPAPKALAEILAVSDWERQARFYTQRHLAARAEGLSAALAWQGGSGASSAQLSAAQLSAAMRPDAVGPASAAVHNHAHQGPTTPPGPFGAPSQAPQVGSDDPSLQADDKGGKA